jgi:hypothetical protein
MTTALYDTSTANAAGVFAPVLTKWPEGGASSQVRLTQGAAVVSLRVSIIPGVKERLVTFTLPVPAGQEGAGNMHDSVAVNSHWRTFDWEVQSITGGGTLTMAVAGVGV